MGHVFLSSVISTKAHRYVTVFSNLTQFIRDLLAMVNLLGYFCEDWEASGFKFQIYTPACLSAARLEHCAIVFFYRCSLFFSDIPVYSFQSSIVRCGQPLIGPTNRRCKEDENILKSLLTQDRGTIIDTRAKHIAQSARSKGWFCDFMGSYTSCLWHYV